MGLALVFLAYRSACETDVKPHLSRQSQIVRTARKFSHNAQVKKDTRRAGRPTIQGVHAWRTTLFGLVQVIDDFSRVDVTFASTSPHPDARPRWRGARSAGISICGENKIGTSKRRMRGRGPKKSLLQRVSMRFEEIWSTATRISTPRRHTCHRCDYGSRGPNI